MHESVFQPLTFVHILELKEIQLQSRKTFASDSSINVQNRYDINKIAPQGYSHLKVLEKVFMVE